MVASNEHQEPWYLRYTVPIQFPSHDGFDLSMSRSAFDALIQDIIRSKDSSQDDDDIAATAVVNKGDAVESKDAKEDSLTVISSATSKGMHDALKQLELSTAVETPTDESTLNEPDTSDDKHPFIQGLLSHDEQGPSLATAGNVENMMFTENADVAYRSTQSSVLDLFAELEDVVSGPRLLELLNAAWKDDYLATLKIIFNARSIHLGKASRATFYRCAGWLAQYHPLTLINNLRWLSRPVIQKKVEKKEEGDNDMVMLDVKPERDADDVTQFDVKNGVSHGYWKDLLNILVLGVNGKLNVLVQPKHILYVAREQTGQEYFSKEEAKARRHDTRDARHDRAVSRFNSDPVYRALYLAVTRLFGEQLRADLELLHNNDSKAKKRISLCAKWAPSHNRFHDKHTFVVSSIAEMLYPLAVVTGGSGDMDRELYLRHARERYRKDVAALRAHLDVVERNITAKTYDKIKYDRVPSLAMNNYAKIFAEKDTERFENYINGVAEGKMRISGATLLPSTLISTVRNNMDQNNDAGTFTMGKNPKAAVEAKMRELKAKVVDAQWKTLVQRIKDSGTLESSIAVCDVSGSMQGPVFPDGTCPLDSSIGLSLLLAEITEPPFGGHFITFSRYPKVERIDPSLSLRKKIRQLSRSDWGMNTDFVAVFEDLILPMAIRNKLSQEDMVKRVFVFSDMQFDQAQDIRDYNNKSSRTLSTSFERIKKKYADAGYEMPELIFWNLAGGRAGYGAGTDGDPTAPKPVTEEETGTAIVSGYSQAMLKVFLDNGSFDKPDDDDEAEMKTTEDGDTVLVDAEPSVKKRKIDPMNMMKKTIGHQAYDPLKVLD
ncbi:hypothetical protein F5Y19DRAFT_277957 [Xylariaceae sp. FL1651]|nr:hypothetical protein F5Y19DRAFT_277957 [Xylariaceae sp. FL1651]